MAISAIETALTKTAFAGFSIDSRRLRESRSGSVSAMEQNVRIEEQLHSLQSSFG